MAGLPAVLAATAVGMVWGLHPYDPAGPPDQVRLSLRGDPHTSMTVVWHAQDADSAVVEVSDGVTTRGVPGRRTGGAPIGAGEWFEADLTGLRPGTTYRYAIAGGDAKTPSYQFRTEPAGPHPVRFDVFADQGDCLHYGPACRVMEGIAEDRPDFVLGAGDLTYANDNGMAAADVWGNDVMRHYATWAPLMPTPGNHEYLSPDTVQNYQGRFALPGEELGHTGIGHASGDYYSFDYGSVHVVALPERYVDMKAGGRFQQWLEDDLRRAAANPAITWRVAFDHRPFYSTGQRHGADHTYVKWVQPVLEKYHFDLVFSGHEHEYERTLPMLKGVASTADRYSWRKGVGIAYVVTGGGGAPVYNDFGPAQPWDGFRKKGHEHLVVDVSADGRTLRMTALDDDNRHAVIDQFTIMAPASTAGA